MFVQIGLRNHNYLLVETVFCFDHSALHIDFLCIIAHTENLFSCTTVRLGS